MATVGAGAVGGWLGVHLARAGCEVSALATLLQQAGFNASVSPQIQKDIWYELWGNMTVNPIGAFTGATTDATTDRILGDQMVRGFVSAAMLEAKAIGERLGIPMDQQPEDRHAVSRKLGAFKTSTLQDVTARKPVELDALVFSVRLLGQLSGVATRFTDALLRLSRLQAQTLGLYPGQFSRPARETAESSLWPSPRPRARPVSAP